VLVLTLLQKTLILSLSKDEPFCSWFDKLTTSDTSRDLGTLESRRTD
jgi:hypothetical protein